jgi:hypothetical protein
MKTVKVSIKDENTLVLQEDASKGDLIDLKSLHDLEIDKTTITAVVNSIRLDKFNEKLEEKTDQIKRENELKWESKEKDINAKKDSEISTLKAQIDKSDTEKKLAVTEAVSVVEKERDELKIKLANQENEKELIKKSYETQIKDRDDSIERLKDMKIKMSTKMIGESLEQFCQNEFNKIRATAFPNAYFEKDNDSSSGSKGDYIFRDPAEGIESVSIMFDMKNENDTTETKKKNEDFLSKLNRDRNEKNCEYAILVSMLEADSDLYNQGIVDVSYKYPKMYVIRPQFFIPMITLLKNAAEKSLEVKNELEVIRSQNIDITNFESQLTDFQSSFGRSFELAHSRFGDAIEGIDKSIAQLQKIKENLQKADDHYRIANSKAEDLSIKQLTRGNPTMTSKFDELKNS